jgi:hypothetical protein
MLSECSVAVDLPEVGGGGCALKKAVETIDGGSATPAELRRVGIEALVNALGPVGMARFLQLFATGRDDYTSDREGILGNPSVDELIAEIERRPGSPSTG